MELELKHLSTYLPYGVTYGVKHLKRKFDILNEKNIQFVLLDCLKNRVKLVLHPLSDLTKEIEHNEEKFIPESYFLNDIETDWFDGNIWVNYLFQGEITDLDFIPYGMMIKLFEWHFDVFGLIENNLAIDINTLKK